MSNHNPFRPFPARRNPTTGGADAASTTARAAARRRPSTEPRQREEPSRETLSAPETGGEPVLGVTAPPTPDATAEATGARSRADLESLDRDDLVDLAGDHGLDTYRVKSTVLVDQLLTIGV